MSTFSGVLNGRIRTASVLVNSAGYPSVLRPPLAVCETPPSSRAYVKRKSPSVNGGAAMRRSPPPPYNTTTQQQASHPPPPPPPNYSCNTPQQQVITGGKRASYDNYNNSTSKSPRYSKSPVLTNSTKVTPTSNGRSTRGSPRSGGPSPNSPSNKLNRYHSSPDLRAFGSSPDENTAVHHNFVSPALAIPVSGNTTNGNSASFICDICSKSFTSRSNLNKHKRVQHSGEEYTCHMCQRSFKNRYYIKEHTSICASSSQKKAAAAAAASAVSQVTNSSPASVAGSIGNYGLPPALSAVTPSAHLAAYPVPLLTVPSNMHATAPRHIPSSVEVYKFEPPDDEQPTDLAIHNRDVRSNSRNNSPL